MYGPTVADPTTYLDEVLNIFVQGVRRVSVALTASLLIAEFAPADLTDALRYALSLEKQAIEDLERLLQVPDVALLAGGAATSTTAAFYFEDKELELTTPLRVELYMPTAGVTAWQPVGTYTGLVSTGRIAADLADAINTATLNALQSNVLAAPVLASPGGPHLHEVRFESRLRDLVVTTELVSVRILPGPLPFVWGVSSGALREEILNSVFIKVERAGAASTATPLTPRVPDYEPVVLYFRRRRTNAVGQVVDEGNVVIPDAVWQNGRLVFRVSPTMDADQVVAVPYLPGQDLHRYSQVALLLLNELFALKGDTRALGALIRNDDIYHPAPVAALELIAWSITNPQTWMILDVVEVPADIELATGDRVRVVTPWSHKPRSIRVPSLYKREAGALPTPEEAGGRPDVRVVKLPDSQRMRRLSDYWEALR
jgi:hypothetical protein